MGIFLKYVNVIMYQDCALINKVRVFINVLKSVFVYKLTAFINKLIVFIGVLMSIFMYK